MKRRFIFAMAAMIFASAVTAKDQEANLKAGWIVAEVEVGSDGSVNFKRMLSKPDLGSFDLVAAINTLQFPPTTQNQQPVTRQTGIFMRYHIVQNGPRRQVVFGDSFLMPLIQSVPERPWPEGAWEDGLGGEVVMEVRISKDGEVVDVSVVDGDAPEVLRAAAVEVAKKTVFEPEIINGRKAASQAIIDLYYEPESAKSTRMTTTAEIPFERNGEGVTHPEYRDHLPVWSDYRKVDEDLTEAVFAWDFGAMPETGKLPASVVHQRVVVPSEAQFFVLPDASAETREQFLNRH